jgi:hypothetical protein
MSADLSSLCSRFAMRSARDASPLMDTTTVSIPANHRAAHPPSLCFGVASRAAATEE